MLTQYRFALTPDRPCRPRAEWAYRLYAALLARLPEDFGQLVHEDRASPVSQFLDTRPETPLWSVTLLGEETETLAGAVLERAEPIRLTKDGVTLTPRLESRERVSDPDALFLRGGAAASCRLEFVTPTAFKSRGKYVNLPTPRLILQSLIKQWNGCFPNCPIEDEDGAGLDALADGLTFGAFRLRDWTYYLRGRAIPGFTGELLLENRLSGFHRELAGALLAFSCFAGVGIKTTLGMGGVRHR